LNSGISIIKIGQKSGNSYEDISSCNGLIKDASSSFYLIMSQHKDAQPPSAFTIAITVFNKNFRLALTK